MAGIHQVSPAISGVVIVVVTGDGSVVSDTETAGRDCDGHATYNNTDSLKNILLLDRRLRDALTV